MFAEIFNIFLKTPLTNRAKCDKIYYVAARAAAEMQMWRNWQTR